MPPTDELPGNPGAVPSGKENEVAKADEDRAARERETIASGDVGDATQLGLTGTPASGEFESTTQGKGGDVSANQGGTGATTERAVGSAAGNNAGADASTTNADGTASDSVNGAAGDDTLGLDKALAVDGNDDDDIPAIDTAGVKSLGQQIYQAALESMHDVALTQDEAEQAKRAAEELAYVSIASIGLTDSQREHLKVQAQRATTTLLNLAVGESVTARQRAKDLIVQVVRRFFSEAIALIAKIPLAAAAL